MKRLKVIQRRDNAGIIFVVQDSSESTETILKERGVKEEEVFLGEHDVLDIPVSKGRFDVFTFDSSKKNRVCSTINVS